MKHTAAILCLCIGLCDGYTTFYGANGQLEGSANSIAGYTTFQNSQGQYLGSANSIGGYTSYYGADGGYAGSSYGQAVAAPFGE